MTIAHFAKIAILEARVVKCRRESWDEGTLGSNKVPDHWHYRLNAGEAVTLHCGHLEDIVIEGLHALGDLAADDFYEVTK